MSYPDKVSPAVLTEIQARSNAIVTTTWANRANAIAAIAALTPANGLVFVSDVGINGSIWHCDGVKLICSNPLTIFQQSIPIVMPSSGSIGDNGALTLTTAIQAAGNYYMYFPANAIAAGVAAGKYYVSMSSTTLGTIYNNAYTSGQPTVPTSPTPFATTGPGAYTQTTASDITLVQVAVLGSLMGKYGSLNSVHWVQQNNTAGIKTTRVNIGGTPTYSVGLGTGTLSLMKIAADIFNSGDEAKQTCTASNSTSGASTTASDLVRLTKDTSANFNITYTGQLATATDWVMFSKIQLNLVNYP